MTRNTIYVFLPEIYGMSLEPQSDTMWITWIFRVEFSRPDSGDKKLGDGECFSWLRHMHNVRIPINHHGRHEMLDLDYSLDFPVRLNLS